MIANDWDDVEEILHIGSKEDILRLRCPDCGGEIDYYVNVEYASMQTNCDSCGTRQRAYKLFDPDNLACVKYFGKRFRIPV